MAFIPCYIKVQGDIILNEPDNRYMELYEGEKEILASSYNNHARSIGASHCIY
jgi:hypothetical protein